MDGGGRGTGSCVYTISSVPSVGGGLRTMETLCSEDTAESWKVIPRPRYFSLETTAALNWFLVNAPTVSGALSTQTTVYYGFLWYVSFSSWFPWNTPPVILSIVLLRTHSLI